jgi:hypothetical protein
MHLVKNVFQVESEHVFAEKALHFDGQIHLAKVEESDRRLIRGWLWSGHLLV